MKKAVSLLLVVLFVFSLCACNKSGSKSGSSSSFAGNWKMESVTGDGELPEGADVTLNISGNTFEMKTTMTESGVSMENVTTGDATVSGSEISLVGKKMKMSFMGQTSESDVEDSTPLKGTIEGGKLVLKSETSTITFVKN